MALYERVREAAAAVPGVESAAISLATPLGSAGVRFTPTITIPGSAVLEGDEVRILMNPVSPGWFRTFGTRLLGGRDFEAHDSAGAPPVAMVNEAFARRYFDGANPLGRTIGDVTEAGERRSWEIVGLVENAAFTSVRDAVEPTIYRPLAQAVDEDLLNGFPTVSLSVRARQGAPARLTSGLAVAIGAQDRDLSVSFLTIAEQLNVFSVRERLLALLSGFFGALALLLAALGLYGTMSHAVSRRSAEIGLRMALGASPLAVLRMVLGRVTLLTAGGIALGLAASVWATRFVGSLLYSIPARDPLTFGISAAVLAVVAGVAGWLPARRAARIAPAVVLREG